MPGGSSSERSRLAPLASLRFVAAFHLFLFHLWSTGRADDAFRLEALDALPQTLHEVIERGYFSTPLFFLLSGFMLAWIYVTPDGGMSASVRPFLVARFTRIYPLHLAVLLLMLLGEIALGRATLAGTAPPYIASALLVQAWIAPLALGANFPTWALSVIAYFYVVFPWVVCWTRSLSRSDWTRALVALPVISLLPTLAYYALGGSARFPDHGPAAETLLRSPLLWLPHFLMGYALCRSRGAGRFAAPPAAEVVRRTSWGDAAAGAVVAFLLCDTDPIRLLLRHGALAPLYLVMLHDLATGRGLLSRILSLRVLSALGETSFALFILQFPVMIAAAAMVRQFGRPAPWLHLGAIVACTLGLAWVSTAWFERPVSRHLRLWLAPIP